MKIKINSKFYDVQEGDYLVHCEKEDEKDRYFFHSGDHRVLKVETGRFLYALRYLKITKKCFKEVVSETKYIF
jgi:hypothetical protein